MAESSQRNKEDDNPQISQKDDIIVSDISIIDIDNDRVPGEPENSSLVSSKTEEEQVQDDGKSEDLVDLEAGVEVPAAIPINQVGLVPPPRTPGGRLLLAPPTPMLEPNSNSNSKLPSQLEQLRTVAFAQLAKHRPNVDEKLRAMYKNLHASMVGVWLRKIDHWLEKHLSHHLRYLYFLIFFQLFPILFFMFRVRPTLRQQCDEPLDVKT